MWQQGREEEGVESRKVRCRAIGSVGSRATAGHRRTAGMKVWYRASWYCWHAGECGTGHGATAGRKVQGMVLAGKCGTGYGGTGQHRHMAAVLAPPPVTHKLLSGTVEDGACTRTH